MSPKIRNKIDINYKTDTNGARTKNILKSAAFQNMLNDINLTEIESQDTKLITTSDSDSSDEELYNIEMGIQKSLEQVTNRLKGYGQNKFSSYS